jgi:hypothetical protein
METGFEGANLIAEVQRYLAAVEIFRAEGCHPHWSSELLPPIGDEVAVEAGSPGIRRTWLERG